MKQQIRETLSKDKMRLLNDFIEKRIQESHHKFYNGKVIDNNDPEKLGRCRIRVFGIYGDDIPDEDVPFAVPDFGFIGSKLGSFIVPPLDAIVKVYFDNENIYAPKYTTKIMDKSNLPSERDEDYPDTMVFFETDQGEFFKINRKTNETTYHSASGVLFIMDSEGNVELNTEEADVGAINILTKDGHKVDITNSGITLEDNTSASNKLEMSSDGVKVNGKFLVTADFLDWLNSNLAQFGLGNLGAPVPVFPAAATQFITGNTTPDKFKTNKA